MNPPDPSRAPRKNPPAASAPGATGTVRDEKRAWRIVLVFVALAALLVLGFNLMAPRDRLQAPAASSPPAGEQASRQQAAPAAPADGTATRSAPVAADTPTPAGREGMGAPALANPGTQSPSQPRAPQER